MAGEGAGVDDPDQKAGDGEHAAFRQIAKADRQTDAKDLAKARPVRPPPAHQDAVAAELTVNQTEAKQGGEHEPMSETG